MEELAWSWHEFSLFIQTYNEYFTFAEKKSKEDYGFTHTREDLLEFQFLGFIVHETEGNEEEKDKEGTEEKKESSFILPPSLLRELEFLGFLDGDKKEVGEEKKEQEWERKQEEEDDDGGYVLIQTPEDSSFTLPPSLLLELEPLGFLGGDSKEVGEEKKEQEREKKQEEEDDDGHVVIQTPEESSLPPWVLLELESLVS